MPGTEEHVILDIFGDNSFNKILATLIENPNRTFTRDELSKEANLSRTTLWKHWEELEEKNIILRVKEGREGEAYALNPDSKIVRSVKLFEQALEGEA